MSSDSASPADEKVADEEILNVFRRSEDFWLPTSDVADELPITQTWTNSRLNELEDQGRVESQPVGQARAWMIGSHEIDFPLDPDLGDLARVLAYSNQFGDDMYRVAKELALFTAIVALATVATVMADISPPMVQMETIIISIYGLLAGVAVTAIIGASLKGIARILPPLLARYRRGE